MPPAPTATPPDQLSGLVRWGKARDLGLADGASVSTYADSSGIGNALANPGGATGPPTFVVNQLNGNAIIRFDGANDSLQGTWTLTQPNTLWAVSKIASTAAERNFVDGKTNFGSLLRSRPPGAGGQFVAYAGAFLVGPATSTAWAIHVAVFSGTSSRYWVNGGVGVGPANGGAASPGGLTLGCLGGLTSFAAFDHAEEGQHNVALSVFDVNRLGLYLAAAHGLAWTTAT